jgi:Putative adhesin
MVGKNRHRSSSVLTLVLLSTTFSLAQDQGREFHWSGKLSPDQIVEIKNLNGKIEARGDNSSDQVEVTAEKSGPDAELVKIEVVPHAEGITICAIYPGGSTRAKSGPCEPGEKWQVDNHSSKAKVDFTVRVPTNLRFAATSINGSVTAEDMGRFVRADSVNGSVRVSTKQWAELSSVNGSLEASMGSADWTGTLKISTVNGSIDLKMPSELNADVRFSSVNGHLDTDYPVSVSGNIGSHRVEGRVGNGGRKLVLDTVNGSVRLKRESL